MRYLTDINIYKQSSSKIKAKNELVLQIHRLVSKIKAKNSYETVGGWKISEIYEVISAWIMKVDILLL